MQELLKKLTNTRKKVLAELKRENEMREEVYPRMIKKGKDRNLLRIQYRRSRDAERVLEMMSDQEFNSNLMKWHKSKIDAPAEPIQGKLVL